MNNASVQDVITLIRQLERRVKDFPRSNWTAVADPSPNDDADKGYQVGSWWYRADVNKLWICQVATLAAAVWQLQATCAELPEDALGFLHNDGNGGLIWEQVTAGGPDPTKVPLEGEAYIVVGGSADPVVNGTALVNAYRAAGTKTPHGQALGTTNRYTIFMLPGRYVHPNDVFTLDTNFVDIKGLGAPDDVVILYQSNVNALALAATDVVIEGFTILGVYVPTGAGLNVVHRRLRFRRGEIMYNCFASGTEASQTYEDCDADGFAFGVNAPASGVFRRCKVTNAPWGGSLSFGSCNTDGVQPVASGLFEDCEGGIYCFGAFGSGYTLGPTTPAPLLSGTFRRIKCGDYCFGSFWGGTVAPNTSGGCTGVFENIVCGNYCFLSLSGNEGVVIELSGKFQRIRAGTSAFLGPTFVGTTNYSGEFRDIETGGNSFGIYGNGSASVEANFAGVFVNINLAAVETGTAQNGWGSDGGYSLGTLFWAVNQALSTNRSWRAICQGTNGLIAVGDIGAIAYSGDGASWSDWTSKSPNQNSWSAICFSSELGRFVAVAGIGQVGNQVMTCDGPVSWNSSWVGRAAYAGPWTSVCWHGFGGMQRKPLKQNNVEDLAGQTARRLPSSAA